METYTIIEGNVQHIGMLADETVRIGNVTLAPVPGNLRYDLGESGTAAIVQVMANSTEEAEKLAALSLENAVTVLTYALCRQATAENHHSQLGELDMRGAVVKHKNESEKVRTWRRGLQGITQGDSDEVAGQVRVTQTATLRLLPRLVGGSLARFVSEPATQTLWQVLSQDPFFRTDKIHMRYAGSIASAATCLRRAMESDAPHDLVDAFTGLEALFTDGTASVAPTIGYGVAYTSVGRNDARTCLSTWKEVKKLYDDRSRVVHGDHLSQEIPHAASKVEKMLVESIEFCIVHQNTILGCGSITDWIDMVRFGLPEALGPESGT